MSERPTRAPREHGQLTAAGVAAKLRGHARSRAGVVAGGVALVLVSGAIRLPAYDEATVERLLGAAVGGEVAAGDLMWEPSRGWLEDLTSGRPVVFLGRAEAGAPRDLYRARVSVLPSGRPLAVRSHEALTTTPQGDESDLVVSGGRALFATRFSGKVESVTAWPLEGGGRPTTIGAGAPASTAAFRLEGSELSLWLDGSRGSLIDLDAGAAVAGEWLPVRNGAIARRPERAAPPALAGGGQAAEAPLPPAGYVAAVTLVPGGEPAISVRTSESLTAVVADGRQLSFEIVLGTRAPATVTGHVPVPEARPAGVGPIVMALELVNGEESAGGGAFDTNGWLGPMLPGRPTIASIAGRLQLGAWGLGPWERTAHDMGIQWSGDAARAGRHALCVTAGGHLAAAWADGTEDPAGALPASCLRVATGAGAVQSFDYGASLELPSAPERTLIVARARDLSPRAPAPKGTSWLASPVGQPTPSFLAGLRQASASALGEHVEVMHLDGSRFDWAVVAGKSERGPRKGGAPFTSALSAADAARARFAVSLGVGTRRTLRGLRISGATGHPFARKEGLLAVRGPLQLGWARDDDPEAVAGDAAELPLTLRDGQVSSAGRERGPRQRRLDLCVSGGEVLVASSEFDSHEANATILGQLGCQLAVALDRGAEREGWWRVATDAAGPFEETALVALDHPLDGWGVGAAFQADPKSP